MEKTTLSVTLLNAVMQYLGNQPYVQVFQLIQAIQKEVEAQATEAQDVGKVDPEGH